MSLYFVMFSLFRPADKLLQENGIRHFKKFLFQKGVNSTISRNDQKHLTSSDKEDYWIEMCAQRSLPCSVSR